MKFDDCFTACDSHLLKFTFQWERALNKIQNLRKSVYWDRRRSRIGNANCNESLVQVDVRNLKGIWEGTDDQLEIICA